MMGFRVPGEDSLLHSRIRRAQQLRNEQDSVIRRRIAHMEFEQETLRWVERMEYDMSLTAGQLLTALERIRDENTPKEEEEWNEAFRNAIEYIPESRMLLEEMTIRSLNNSQNNPESKVPHDTEARNGVQVHHPQGR